ncbi:MAG: apiosidase-like domain-containing protein [Candidatus Latescibacterota bacterium]
MRIAPVLFRYGIPVVFLWAFLHPFLHVAGAAGFFKTVFPQKTWESRRPEEAGMDEAALDRLRDFMGGRGCVIRRGVMVYSWGEIDRRGDIASAAKPVYAHFLLHALEKKMIPGLDQPVLNFVPQVGNINAELGHKDRAITWRHCANQTSCYGVMEYPGTAYDYNDWQMAFFWDALFQGVYRATLETVDDKVMHPFLTDAISCEDNPTFLAFGKDDRPGRTGISVRDFARFGLLYLRRGNWNGKQVLDGKLAVMAVSSPLSNAIPRTAGLPSEMIPDQRTIGSKLVPDNQTDHYGSYSWLWWTNGTERNGRRHWPDAPVDLYAALGHGGKRGLAVIPSLDIVVSWNESNITNSAMENEAFRFLTGAVTDGTVKPAGQSRGSWITADPRNPGCLIHRDGTSFFLCGPGDPEDFLYRGEMNSDGTRIGDQQELIEKLKGTGANSVYVQAIRSHGGDGDRTNNPFFGNDPAKGINPAVLDQWEAWFGELDRNGVAIFFILYDDNASVWNTGDAVGREERQFIETLVNRFEHHGNLIWCIAEEYQEKLSPERAREIAGVIRAADDHDHLIAVHKLHGLDFSEFAGERNIDIFAVQYNVSTPDSLHRGMVSAVRQAAGRYAIIMSEAAGHGIGAVARKKNWACAMAGAHVMALGMDIASTPPSDLEDCGRLVRFFQTTDAGSMPPHDELAHGETAYILANPGERYIAYAPEAREALGVRNMRVGTYTLRWYDCATGKEATRTETVQKDGDRVWNKPEFFGGEVAVSIQKKKE